MKFTKRLLGLTAVLALNSYAAFAENGGVGNGGVSFVCRNNAGDIQSARLLDTWEPETFSAHNTNGISADEQLKAALAKINDIDPITAQTLNDKIKSQIPLKFFTKKGLALTNDALPDYVSDDPDCKFEQVARLGYVNELDKVMLSINRPIFDKFSETDKAALFLHEALYAIDKTNNQAETSRVTRRNVALLFSDVPLTSKSKIEIVKIAFKVHNEDPNNNRDRNSPLFINGTSAMISLEGEVQFVFPDALSGKRSCKYELKNGENVLESESATSSNKIISKKKIGVFTPWTREVKVGDILRYSEYCDDGVHISGGVSVKSSEKEITLSRYMTYRVINVE